MDDHRPSPLAPLPSLRTMTGVARALIGTVGIDQAVPIITEQFGWDLAFAALAHIDGPDGGRALWLAVQQVVVDPA